MAVPLTCPVNVLVTGLVNPRGIAVDDTYVYVAVHGSGTASDGKILRITR